MKKTVILIVICIVLIAAITTGLLLLFPSTASPTETDNTDPLLESKEPTKEEIKVYPYVMPDSFVTNMKNSNGFVQASLMLEITNENDLKFISDHNYILSDTIINVLRNTTEEEYMKDDIQQILRERLRHTLMTSLEIDSIRNVYFLELIIQ